LDPWKTELEEILRQIPGYNPWDQAECWLDHEAALKAINWFGENLKHIEGDSRGDPFILRAWQAAIIGNLFGWKRKDEAGRTVRRYRKCLIKVGRGNGKTPLASGIVLYGFFEDGEPGGQNILAAGQKEQAGILFRNAIGMVDQNPELASKITAYRGDQHRSMILKDDPLSFCKVIPADAAGQHGGIPHIVVVDELHVQENRDLLDVFETAMAKKTRSQPMLVMITTSDFDRPSICNEVDDYAHKVRDNGGDPAKPGFDPYFLPIVYEVPQDADWTDEKEFVKANPERRGQRAARKLACRLQEGPGPAGF
jgi:phage terminase large subunit-like protein